MLKRFSIGNIFLTDTRVEPLFNLIIPQKKNRMDGYIIYEGESRMFDHIKGEVAKIGYRAGQFKAFEANEVEIGWLYLDQKNQNFDSEITLPSIITSTGTGVEITPEEKKKYAAYNYDMIMNHEATYADINDRESFVNNLSYQQLLAFVTNESIGMKFDSRKAGGRKLEHVKKYLLNWKPE
jgi:hypothetical protein